MVGVGGLLLCASEAAFEFAPAHFDEGGASMGAGVGHGAGAEVLNEAFEFGALQGVVGLDRMAANGFGDHVLTEAEGVDAATGGFEGIDEIDGETARVPGSDEGGEGVEKEGAFAERPEAHAEAGQDVGLATNEFRVAHGEFECFRQEQMLGGSLGALLHAGEHLLV